MKPITFSKTSWHYKLVDKMDFLPPEYEWDGTPIPTDICTYSRKLFACIGLCLLLGTIALTIGPVAFANFFSWIAVRFVTGQWAMLDTVGCIAIAELMLAAFGMIRYFGQKVIDSRKAIKSHVPNKPSIIREIYRKFKDKTCVQINFE